MVFGKEMNRPGDAMMGCPDSLSNQDELEYIWGLRDRLEDTYDVAREHLKSSVTRQKKYYDVRANERSYEPENLVWTMKQ